MTSSDSIGATLYQCDRNQHLHIIKKYMSFNFSRNLIVQSQTETSVKFPKSASKMSLATEAGCYPEPEFAPRKITREQKQRFLDIITTKNINMKEAAKIVGMSYSTAKKVFARFRKSLKIMNSMMIEEVDNGIVCGYTELPTSESPPSVKMVTVISTIGGREQLRSQKRHNIPQLIQTRGKNFLSNSY